MIAIAFSTNIDRSQITYRDRKLRGRIPLQIDSETSVLWTPIHNTVKE